MGMICDITKALHSASKVIYKEEERARKKSNYHTPREYQNSTRIIIKKVVYEVIPEAVRIATGNGQYPVSARNLYYQVRPLIEDNMSGKELDYGYFSQTLLTEYQDKNGPIKGLYYDPRGVLFEPHSGKSIQLGTREVADYEFPSWLYNKILYIEKKGLWPIIESAKIAERYDMAVIAAEGYATEAARILFKNAHKDQNYELYVLHDADPYGYNIALTLHEETKRMPDYSVNVFDLGLLIEDAIEMGLQTETFIRKKALPSRLNLSDIEKEYFIGEYLSNKKWKCKRIELNALTAPQLIKYIEDKLDEAGASGKVIPPDEKLEEFSEEFYKNEINNWVDDAIAQIMSIDDIKYSIASEFMDSFHLEGTKEWIIEDLGKKPILSWRRVLQLKLRILIIERNNDLTKALKQQINLSNDYYNDDDDNE